MAELEDIYWKVLFKLTDPIPDQLAGAVVVAGVVAFDYATLLIKRVLP